VLLRWFVSVFFDSALGFHSDISGIVHLLGCPDLFSRSSALCSPQVRRESTDIEDIFIGHIGAMDTFALALRRAAAMHESGVVQRMVEQRYASYADGIGAKVCRTHAHATQ
jgi:xylose isomerase